MANAPSASAYRGAPIGFTHRWHYDGRWHERKVRPDRWDLHFRARKTRTQACPPGRGVPLGTEYHWIIVGWQRARRTTWDDYETLLQGHKFLGAWTPPLPVDLGPARRDDLRARTVTCLERVLRELRSEERDAAPPLEATLERLSGEVLR